MKRHAVLATVLGLVCCLILAASNAPAQPADDPKTAKAGAAKTAASAKAVPTPDEDLKTVLAGMDKAAANFKSAKADLDWVTYTKAVDDTYVQTGQISFRRSGKNGAGKDIDVAMHIVKPHGKHVVIKDGKVKIHDDKTKQTTVRDIPGNRDDADALMSLGFGSPGQDLLKFYDVTMAGWETVDNVKAARLELVGKSDRLKGFFSKVILWIDPVRDVSLKQQRFQSSGDYQVAHFTNIRLNSRIPDDDFRVKD